MPTVNPYKLIDVGKGDLKSIFSTMVSLAMPLGSLSALCPKLSCTRVLERFLFFLLIPGAGLLLGMASHWRGLYQTPIAA